MPETDQHIPKTPAGKVLVVEKQEEGPRGQGRAALGSGRGDGQDQTPEGVWAAVRNFPSTPRAKLVALMPPVMDSWETLAVLMLFRVPSPNGITCTCCR